MAVDIIPEKVDLINNKKSPIQDNEIEEYLATKELNLTATLDGKAAYSSADFVVIVAPTNYDSKNIIFSPEFLRESKALYDNLYPSRIVVGTDLEDERLVKATKQFAALLQGGAIKKEILIMGFTEAEAGKTIC